RAGLIPRLALGGVPAEARAALGLDAPGPPPSRTILDAMGRVVEVEHADGTRESWRYDAEGNCIEYIDADGASYTRTYTSWNLLAAETDPLGYTTRYEHSLRGLVTAYTDAGGSHTSYRRDAQERIVEVARD